MDMRALTQSNDAASSQKMGQQTITTTLMHSLSSVQHNDSTLERQAKIDRGECSKLVQKCRFSSVPSASLLRGVSLRQTSYLNPPVPKSVTAGIVVAITVILDRIQQTHLSGLYIC